MTTLTYLSIAFWLSLLGVLFSGYLSLVRLITKQCAFNEPCPTVFGYPACWFGFALFVVLFAAAALARYGVLQASTALMALKVVGLVGILFAGYFTVGEIATWIGNGVTRSALVLPTCSYGLVFFALIFGLAFAAI